MYYYLPVINYKKTFNSKPEKVQKLIREALQIIMCLGIPMDGVTDRQKEKTAMALLAVGDVSDSRDWKKIKNSNDDYALTTREIIDFHNEYLAENISRGSYDDILRKDLAPMLQATIVIPSKPAANTSNPTRGYKINVEYARVIKNYGQPDWFTQVETFNKSHPTYAERISAKRDIPKLTVATPDGNVFQLKDGEHNAIQKQIIEDFLPRYGYGAELLYCGDSNNKYGVVFETDKLAELGFKDLKQSKLPDVVAFSPKNDWIYMIEAYHTSNPITPQRKYELEQLMGAGVDKAIFITAFENISAYRGCAEELAWETEVWIATEPDHIIHRDGSRFMGPYSKKRL